MGSIAINLGPSERRNDLRGWDCHLLQLSRTSIADVRLKDGRQVPSDYYRPEPNLLGGLLRWSNSEEKPEFITVVIDVETKKMNRAATVLKYLVPIIVAVITTTGVITTAVLGFLGKNPENSYEDVISKIKTDCANEYNSRVSDIQKKLVSANSQVDTCKRELDEVLNNPSLKSPSSMSAINSSDDGVTELKGISGKNIYNLQSPKLGLGSKKIIFKKSKLTAASKAALDDVCQKLKEEPGEELRIEANTDSQGSDAENRKRTDRAAESVKNYIVDICELSGKNITAKGYGDERPLAPNDVLEGRQRNRYINIFVK